MTTVARSSTALVVTIRIDGVRETLKAFRELPKDASTALKERTLELSRTLAGKVEAAARADNPQTALMAPTVKARRDRVPSIQAGGTKKVGRNRVPAYKVLFGSEFGATYLNQFRPHLGRGSYWFFDTITDNEDTIGDAWNRVASDVIREFTEGGDV